MDAVFQEEQRKLAEIEARIDSIATRHEQHGHDLQAEILDFYCVDNEDRMRKRELIQDQLAAYNIAEKFRSYQASPYFGRIDFDHVDNDGSETFYIGKEGIADNAQMIVVDWRTPMGSCYYAANQKEFTVNGRDYLLALRRALDIKDGQLITYRTEYDGETVSLEGDVIDPFLLTVLKDKRRHNRLTDIIRTIQGNQNEIIRKDRTESFVVQGCAGSGKTMILLHRLSYLKFNNRGMSLGGVKIITPNKFFDAHINDLSKELGLTSIERFSVEEYYVHLIRKYASKISVDAIVQSEKILSHDLLKHLYSVDYLNKSIENYHSYWNQVVAEIDRQRLASLFAKLRLSYPDTSVHTAEVFGQLEQGHKQLSTAMVEAEKKYQQVVSRLKSIETDIVSAQKEFDEARNTLQLVTKQTLSRIEIEMAEAEKELEKSKIQKSTFNEEKAQLHNKRVAINAELEATLALVQAVSSNSVKYTNYDNVVRQNDSVSTLIKNKHKSLVLEIAEIERQYSNTPAYNFSKRNSLRRKLAELKMRFSEIASMFLSQQLNNAKETQARLRSALKEIDSRITEIDEQFREVDKNNKPHNVRLTALSECQKLFLSQDYPDVRKALMPASRKECGDAIAAYEGQHAIYERRRRTLQTYSESKRKLESEKVATEKGLYSSDDIAFVTDCSKIIKKLQFNEISRNVMFRDLVSSYKHYGQKYSKTNYRHKIYLKLLFCSLYFSRTIISDNFLNIDEAQDISIAEYRLLRMVLGEKCVFNLYGDINQSVYSYKGINDWADIAEATTGNVYILNENYRNTLQITEFCNNEFSSEVYPIGISGDEVVEYNTTEAVKWIVELKKKNPEFRVAILHRHGVMAIHTLLTTLLEDEDVSWYSVDEKKISVLSVETAKGLEFEAIVAIVDQMSVNEKYISYTRALDKLCVVRDRFASDLMTDSGAEDFGEELFDSEDADVANQDHLEGESAAPDSALIIDAEPQDETPVSTEQETVVPLDFSEEDSLLIAEMQDALQEHFGDDCKLTKIQQSVLCSLYHGESTAFSAPSGSLKSVILYLLAAKEHQNNGKQSIITAESHLQENELVLADQLGLRGGVITDSWTDFLSDFKKEQYDILFVPYEFFENDDNTQKFIEYFSGKISYWGVDHLNLENSALEKVQVYGAAVDSIMYLMSKNEFKDCKLDDFKVYEVFAEAKTDLVKKFTFISIDEKHKWLLDNLNHLYGQGLIYCEDDETCKKIVKVLRKNKILAEAYIEIANPNKRERVNYLTNSFSSGGLPILVATHEAGKNLSNAKIRFVLHYDVPTDRQLYELHTMQIGQLAESPAIFDLHIV